MNPEWDYCSQQKLSNFVANKPFYDEKLREHMFRHIKIFAREIEAGTEMLHEGGRNERTVLKCITQDAEG